MDLAAWTEVLPSIAMAIALAACAGLRAWLPLLLGGALARAGILELGPSFQFLSSDRALFVFAVASLIEILGDKIPVVDHALDSLSTVLRPAAGSILAASVLWQVKDPLTALALGVAVGAPTALVPHVAKSALRAASTSLTLGIANPILSLIEDLLAIALFVVAVLLPMAALLALLVVAFLVFRRLTRPRTPVQAT